LRIVANTSCPARPSDTAAASPIPVLVPVIRIVFIN
jgi:hypothetical protein